MSDEKDTVQMPAITGNGSSPMESEADQTLTDEFRIDQDVDENVATRRLESSQLPTVKGSLRESTSEAAAVPGDNSTMPLPAVSASRTEANRVPEAVLASMRQDPSGETTAPASSAIKGESAIRAPTIGPNDETVDRKRPTLPNESKTVEQYPEISFLAEVDRDGNISIPRKYLGLLRFGQRVAVRVQAVPQHEP